MGRTLNHPQDCRCRFCSSAIGLNPTIIHIVTIPISNTSVNPARSLATAVYGGAFPMSQLWVFILAPLAGAALAGLSYRAMMNRNGD